MKSAHCASVLFSAVSIMIGLFAVNACSAPPSVDIVECDSTPLEASPRCTKPVDAGTDADTDAPSAKNDPGLEPSFFPDPNACKGDCVPEASDSFALDWPYEPLVVWFGSKSELDAKTCPVETPFEKVRGFDKLVAPPAKCDACACLAEGSCIGLPATIEIRSGTCNASNVETTPFNGPPNWNGSCTSVDAMPAGKLCNGVPCSQSVSASTLPGPTNESCTPTVEKPNATIDKHEWLEGALACRAKDLDGTCATTPEHCVNTLSEGWLHCLARTGKYDVCPDNYDNEGPRWVYQDNPIDDRGCSACACGTPKDGVCIGSFRLYSEASCTTEINKYQMASTGPLCADLQPPGLALGSKTISELSFHPGTCAVTGGEPIGAVIPNDNENSGVVTFCCRAPGLPPPKQPG